MKSKHKELEKALGYRFRRKKHLIAALTHRSYRFEVEGVERDNQRLEFLGDAVLGLVAADHVFQAHREKQEGKLTHLRSNISNRRALYRIGLRLDLGQFLLFGKGEESSGGAERDSNIADCLEAILGAAYVDGGLKAARKIFEHVFLDELDGVPDDTAETNPKGGLQELTQRHWKVGPRYKIISEVGPPHDKTYTAQVLIKGQQYGEGTGSNKQMAEIQAARAAFQRLTQELNSAAESTD